MWWSWLAVAEAEDGPIQLSKEVARVREEIRVELQPETCPAILEAVYRDLERLRVEEVHRADLAAHTPEIVLGVFAARVDAQEAIARFAKDGKLTHECVTALRRAQEALAESRVPGHELSCSLGTSLPSADGTLVRVYDIRAIPRKP